jgi:type VI secretion system protein ImpJ
MSWDNRVVWSEGLFLRPQHFQQADRYFENLVRRRAANLRP